MSIGNNFWHWCRISPQPPKNRHKKLLASTMLCTIIGISIFASLAPFYGSLMAGPGGLELSSTILSVANSGDGPFYIKNATFQPVAETNNSIVQNYEPSMQRIIQDNPSRDLSFGATSGYCADDSGNINATIVNFGDKDLTVTSIEIYRGNYLFASLDGPFIVTAHTAGTVNFQVYNLAELSKTEAQLITQIRNQQGGSNITIFAGRVMYTGIVKTSDGVTASFEKFLFPTDYFSRISS